MRPMTTNIKRENYKLSLLQANVCACVYVFRSFARATACEGDCVSYYIFFSHFQLDRSIRYHHRWSVGQRYARVYWVLYFPLLFSVEYHFFLLVMEYVVTCGSENGRWTPTIRISSTAKQKIDSGEYGRAQRIVCQAIDPMMIINEFVCKQYRYYVLMFGTTRSRYIVAKVCKHYSIITLPPSSMWGINIRSGPTWLGGLGGRSSERTTRILYWNCLK